VTAVFRAQPTRKDASVTLDFESSEHTWVARSEVPAWLPRLAFASMSAAVSDWASGDDR
jgi:hypothetical protein